MLSPVKQISALRAILHFDNLTARTTYKMIQTITHVTQ